MNLYLVSTNMGYAPGPKELKRLEKSLRKAGIVGGYYDRDENQFLPGPEACAIFTDPPMDRPAFAFLELCCYDAPHFVPDSYGGGFDAFCPHCDEPLNDGLITVAIDSFNEEGEMETFACPECDEAIELRDLPCEIGFDIVNFAVYLRGAAEKELSPLIHNLLSETTGQRFRVFEETP